LKPDIDALYRRYGPMVLRRCRQLLRDEAMALDLMQDVFVKVLERRDSLSLEAPSSLFYHMATNLCLNRIRDYRRLRMESSLSQDDKNDVLARIATVEDASEQIGAANVLNRIFRRHPASTRTIATLHLYDGMTLQEVASETGMSVSGVRKRLRLLKSQLPELREV